jgi:RNA ligase (TIGR02306 family)
MSSLSRAEVVEVEKVEPHPNADRLDIAYVSGFPVVIQKGTYLAGDLGVYIPHELVVSDEPEFAFLSESDRRKPIKAKKLRGVMSCGLLVPLRPHHKLGDDVTQELGITKWEPTERLTTYSNAVRGPSGGVEYTDIDSLRKWNKILHIGEEVVITEKIHGANGRFVYQNDTLHVGSRTRWIDRKDESVIWNKVAAQKKLDEVLARHPNHIVFGEVYGQVQDLKYDIPKGKVEFRVFDIFDITNDRYLTWKDVKLFCAFTGLWYVPELYVGPWHGLEAHKPLGEGKSTIANNIKEGFVVKPLVERFHYGIGRVALKYVSDDYLLRKHK